MTLNQTHMPSLLIKQLYLLKSVQAAQESHDLSQTHTLPLIIQLYLLSIA